MQAWYLPTVKNLALLCYFNKMKRFTAEQSSKRNIFYTLVMRCKGNELIYFENTSVLCMNMT